MVGLPHESADLLLEEGQQPLGRKPGAPVDGLQQPRRAEELLVRRGGLGDAVGVLKHRVPGGEGERLVPIAVVLHPAQHKAGALADIAVGPLMADQGVFVAGVGVDQTAGGQLQHPQPDGDKHPVVVAAQLVVDLAEHLGGRLAG